MLGTDHCDKHSYHSYGCQECREAKRKQEEDRRNDPLAFGTFNPVTDSDMDGIPNTFDSNPGGFGT